MPVYWVSDRVECPGSTVCVNIYSIGSVSTRYSHSTLLLGGLVETVQK